MIGAARVSLKPASAHDLEFVRTCAREAYQPYVADIGREPAPMVADFAEHLRQNELELITFEDAPVGYVVSWLSDGVLFVDNIAITAHMRGHGLARTVFDQLSERGRASSANAIELYTNEKMTANLALYPKLDFEEFDRRSEDGFARVYFRKIL